VIQTSQGSESFRVTFEEKGEDNWIVRVIPTPPGQNPPPMPTTF